MKKTNKLTVLALSVLMLLSFIPAGEVFAEEEIVYYQNTFDLGIDSLVNSTNDYGSFVKNTESKIGTVTLNDNTGIGVANPSEWMGRTNYFQFNEALTDGVLSVSFDIARTSDSFLSNAYSTALTINKTTSETNVMLFHKDGNIKFDGTSIKVTQKDTVYNMKAVFDLDNDIVYVYVDDEKVAQKALESDFAIYDAGIGISDVAGYIDNLKISKITLSEEEPPTEGDDNNNNNTDLPENVYFDKDFENGILPHEGEQNKHGTYQPNINKNQAQLVTFNGSTGMGSTSATYAPEYVFVFDTPITSGVLSVSYDVAMFDDGTGSQLSTLKINSKASKTVTGVTNNDIIILRPEGALRGPNSSLNYTGDTGTEINLELNKAYTLNAVFDLDNKKVYAYCNGELITSQNLADGYTIYDAGFGIGTVVDYLDNFRISQMTDDSFEIIRATGEKDGAYIDVFFTEVPMENCLKADNITVTDAVGNENEVQSLEVIAQRGVRINLDKVLDNGGYILKLSDSFVNALGNAVSDLNYNFVVGEGRFLKSIKLKDIYGNTMLLSDKNIPEISSVILEFTDEVNAAEVNGISLEGKTFEINCSENVAQLVLDGVFMGDSTYTLSITASLDKDYSAVIATDAGGVKHKETLFYVNDTLVTDLSGVEVNDKVSVVSQYVKTIPEKKSFLVSASLWNGLDMNDYAFKYAVINENETLKEIKLDFEIKSTDNLKIKSFNWKGYGKINPIWDMSEIN